MNALTRDIKQLLRDYAVKNILDELKTFAEGEAR